MRGKNAHTTKVPKDHRSNPGNVKCAIHTDEPLVCSKCMGAAGGRKTARTYKSQMADWGKKGGKARVKKAKRRSSP